MLESFKFWGNKPKEEVGEAAQVDAREADAQQMMNRNEKLASGYRETLTDEEKEMLKDCDLGGYFGNFYLHTIPDGDPKQDNFNDGGSIWGTIKGQQVKFDYDIAGFRGTIDGKDILAEEAEALYKKYLNIAKYQNNEKKSVEVREREGVEHAA
jgi:hypothetical protein